MPVQLLVWCSAAGGGFPPSPAPLLGPLWGEAAGASPPPGRASPGSRRTGGQSTKCSLLEMPNRWCQGHSWWGQLLARTTSPRGWGHHGHHHHLPPPGALVLRLGQPLVLSPCSHRSPRPQLPLLHDPETSPFLLPSCGPRPRLSPASTRTASKPAKQGLCEEPRRHRSGDSSLLLCRMRQPRAAPGQAPRRRVRAATQRG